MYYCGTWKYEQRIAWVSVHAAHSGEKRRMRSTNKLHGMKDRWSACDHFGLSSLCVRRPLTRALFSSVAALSENGALIFLFRAELEKDARKTMVFRHNIRHNEPRKRRNNNDGRQSQRVHSGEIGIKFSVSPCTGVGKNF